MKYLIINADDFGLNQNINEGIINACQTGAITHTTLLIKGAAAKEAVSFAHDNYLTGVGLHLDLDEIFGCVKNRPYRFSRKRLSELFNKDGFIQRVSREIEEQILLFKETSLQLTHIDGHHHLHALPELFPVIIEKMVKYDIKSVRFSKYYDLIQFPPIEWDNPFYVEMKKRLNDKAIKIADYFVSAVNIQTPRSLRRGITELMVHPGMGETWREKELHLLTSPEWKEELKKNKIRLRSFSELA